ncbi:Werner Syndrome-like exonuclease [Raphanus sativus]|uniref:3'-5' exonuclease n=1 Tax=Raphanus sativus TaxID=3726 RepID=A0A9W3D0C6_RAPSA|nr:3'-5' exonuclease-like [Raphanus sativus]KAJ4866783.1 Werner Syndrome-like exonuclease [Raphanus sativus]
MSSSWGDEEFTEEDLVAIEAIEASHLSQSSSSSTVRPATSNPNQIRRRQLPRSITSPTPSKRFPLSRCRAKNFPAMRFGGRILYSKTASEVDRRAMQLLKVLDTKRDHSGRAFIGFDIEWRPNFRKGVLPGKVAVVQICVDNSYCDVMQIIHSGIPQSLQHLIEDSTLVKVGIGINGDSVKLFHDHGVSIKDVEDLSDLANRKIGGGLKKWGLASLTETLVCKELLKPNRIRLGNWEVRPLSKEQLQYAATDAYASWHLYHVLKDLPDAVD